MNREIELPQTVRTHDSIDPMIETQPPSTKSCLGRCFKDWSQVLALSQTGLSVTTGIVDWILVGDKVIPVASAVFAALGLIYFARIGRLAPRKKIEELIEKISLKEREIQDLNTSISGNNKLLETTKKAFEEEIEKLKSQEESAKRELDLSSKNLDDLQKTLKESQDKAQKIEKLYTELKDLVSKLEGQIKQVNQVRSGIVKQTHVATEGFKKTVVESNRLGTQTKQLENENVEFKERNQDFRVILVEATDQLSDLKRMYTDPLVENYKKQLDNVKQENEKLLQSLRECQKQIDELKSVKAELIQKLEQAAQLEIAIDMTGVPSFTDKNAS